MTEILFLQIRLIVILVEVTMKLYSYIVTRDFGFAPNPFYGYCTLATCKPAIRRCANIGDIVVGIGSAAKGSLYKNRLIYAMIVSEKLTFDEYWNCERYECKRPFMNGSKKKMYGDNVYHISKETGKIIQEDSHHSFEHGVTNTLNYTRDLSGEYVLIAEEFWYWGGSAIELPDEFLGLANVRRSHIVKTERSDSALIHSFLSWLRGMGNTGYIGAPQKFSGSFQRYNGK